jgi:hypothetical protein
MLDHDAIFREQSVAAMGKTGIVVASSAQPGKEG